MQVASCAARMTVPPPHNPPQAHQYRDRVISKGECATGLWTALLSYGSVDGEERHQVETLGHVTITLKGMQRVQYRFLLDAATVAAIDENAISLSVPS